jgi:hypothetical protein
VQISKKDRFDLNCEGVEILKKTEVAVHFNGDSNYYYFSMDKETFMKRWDNQLPAVGHFSLNDQNGNWIVINPSHCGVIEIREVIA